MSKFKVGDEVELKEGGIEGTIIRIDTHGRHYVCWYYDYTVDEDDLEFIKEPNGN